jgi:hypothetical protein
MIAPSGQELPLLCPLPTTRTSARTAATSRGSGGPSPTHGSTPSQAGTARACGSAGLHWGNYEANGRGEGPTWRGLVGPKSGPSRPQVGA